MSCTCTTAGGNTGVPFCSPMQGVMHNLILVPKYASDGSLNFIDLENDTLDATYFQGKINAELYQDRFFPLPFMENIENSRAEFLNETTGGGNIYRIKQGARTLKASFFKQSPQYLGRLEQWFCLDFGVYEVDNQGSLAGTLSSDGTKLYPRFALKGSMDVVHEFATDTTVPKNMLTFQYAEAVKDSEIGLILADSMGDADLLSLNGLLDVSFKATAVTATGFNATINTLYGDALNPVKIEGLLTADFEIFNKTQSTSVTITSVTETTAGVYAFVYPSQASADELEVKVVKNGFAKDPKTVLIP